jgi:hypothetical protein
MDRISILAVSIVEPTQVVAPGLIVLAAARILSA